MKGLTVYIIAIAMGMSLSFGSPVVSAADPIIHDGEYILLNANTETSGRRKIKHWMQSSLKFANKTVASALTFFTS